MIRILFLGANPSDTTRLALDKEIREIARHLRATPRGGAFDVRQESALRASDLQAALLRHEPHIVHFSGHGVRGGASDASVPAGSRSRDVGQDAGENIAGVRVVDGILVEDDAGRSAPIGADALGDLFRILRGRVRCVVLNACFSELQAGAIAHHVDCVVGMSRTIDDSSAITFAWSFYQALGFGRSIEEAFHLGRNQVLLAGLVDADVPKLLPRDGVDPAQVHVPAGGDAAVAEQHLPASDAPFHVPFFRNEHFVGREEDLERLHALLGRGEAVGVRPAALTGMGGVGKTQLAVEYAYRFRGAYPGGVYWVNAAESWESELAALAERVGLREDGAPEADRARRLSLAFLAYLRERPGALVIFDNVEDPRALRAPLLGVIPTQLRCRLLFTTRRRDSAGAFAVLDVGALPEAESLDLLLASDERRAVLESGAGDELGAARAICRMLGGLPLALSLAGAYLAQNPEIPLIDYCDRLLQEGALAALDEAEVAAEDLPTRHAAAVRATLALQWEELKAEAERDVLRAAALLGEAAEIPRARLALLTGLADRAERGRAAPLAAALRRLRALSLVDELTEQAIRLHPLVRELADETIIDREAFGDACAERLCAALWDMRRLHDEVAARGPGAVLQDLLDGERLAGPAVGARLDRLLRPLDREAHCLRGWDSANEPWFFLQQLRNRCFEMQMEDVQARAEAELDARSWPHLRQRTRTSRESEAVVRTLVGHTGLVNAVGITPNGRFAVSASDDRTLKVWELATGQVIRTLEGHSGPVSNVVVAPDGRFAVSASNDRTLKVWKLSSGQMLRTLEGHTDTVNDVTITPNGRFAVSASRDRTVRVWELSTGHVVHVLEDHTDAVDGVAVTADGRFAVSASRDKTLKIWDLRTGERVITLLGHAHWVSGVAVTPDGRFAVSASADEILKVWDLSTGQEVRSFASHNHWVSDLAVTPDGRFVVSASTDDTLKVWELSTGHRTCNTVGGVRAVEGHSRWVTGIAATADRRFAVSASRDWTLRVWDLATGKAIRTLEGHAYSVTGVAVTPDGRIAISTSEDATLKLWDLTTGDAIRTCEGHTSTGMNGLAVTPDGRYVVAVAGETLGVRELATGQLVGLLEGHTRRVQGVALTPDGCFAVSASSDKTLKVWDLSTGHVIHSLEGHTRSVTHVAVTPNGRFVVSASSGRTLKVWDMSTGHLVHTLQGHTRPVTNVVVTPDGRFALSGSADHTLKLWELSTGHPVRTLQGHTHWVTGVAVTPDGRFAVSTSYKTLKIWDLSTGRAVVTLQTHAPLACCTVAFDKLRKTFLAGDVAGGLHIVDWLP